MDTMVLGSSSTNKHVNAIHCEHRTKFLIYKTLMCTSNLHNNTVFCLLQHVSAERRHAVESQYTHVKDSLKYNKANPGGRLLLGNAGSNPD
jgi:hypothetical protein